MGVRGLTTFVRRHDQLLERQRLCDEQVLVDGDNLMYRLSARTRALNPALAGEYQRFAEAVEFFFTQLRKCGITPVVFLDGGSDPSNRKARTALRRLSEKLAITRRLTVSNQDRVQCLPILSKPVLIQVLQSIGVEYVVCDWEADEHIASLASRLNCAVLSDDSDFYAFAVRCVLLSSLSDEPKIAEDGATCYIEGVAFRHDRFLSQFGLTRSLVPLLACCLGNDYMSAGSLSKFFRHHATVPYGQRRGRHRRRPGGADRGPSPSDVRIRGLLAWLRPQEDAHSALQQIVDQLPLGDRARVKAIVETSMYNYTNPSTELTDRLSLTLPRSDNQVVSVDSGDRPLAVDDCSTVESFAEVIGSPSSAPPSEDIGMASDDDDASDDPSPATFIENAESLVVPSIRGDQSKPLAERHLPAHLLPAIRRGDVTADVINLISGQPLLQEPQPEDFRESTACACVLPLLSLTRQLFLHSVSDKSPYMPAGAVPLYLRGSGTAVVRGTLPAPAPLQPLLDTRESSENTVLSALGTCSGDLSEIGEPLRLLAGAMLYWCCNSQPAVTTAQLTAAVLCAAVLSDRRNIEGGDGICTALDEVYKRYSTVDVSGGTAYCRRQVHVMCQYQCVLVQARNLSAVVPLCLLKLPDFRYLYSGSLVYNLSRDGRNATELMLRTDPDWLQLRRTVGQLSGLLLPDSADGLARNPTPSVIRRKRPRQKSDTTSGSVELHKIPVKRQRHKQPLAAELRTNMFAALAGSDSE